MSKVYKASIAIVLAGVIVSAVWYIFFHETIHHRYERTYPQITVGMSKPEVTALIGQPDDVRCDYRPKTKCEETYVYYTFLELWGVNFDEKGKVSGKYNMVSP